MVALILSLVLSHDYLALYLYKFVDHSKKINSSYHYELYILIQSALFCAILFHSVLFYHNYRDSSKKKYLEFTSLLVKNQLFGLDPLLKGLQPVLHFSQKGLAQWSV